MDMLFPDIETRPDIKTQGTLFVRINSHRSRAKFFRACKAAGLPKPVAHWKWNGGHAYRITLETMAVAARIRGVTKSRDQSGWSECWSTMPPD